MNDLNGMWPNPIKWVKDKTKKAAKAVGNTVNKAGKAVGEFYAKHRDAVNMIGGVAIIGAGMAVAVVAAPLVGLTAGVAATTVAVSGTSITEALGGERTIPEIVCDSCAVGLAQLLYSKTVGSVFASGKNIVEEVWAKGIMDAFDYDWQYGFGTIVTILSNGLINIGDVEKE